MTQKVSNRLRLLVFSFATLFTLTALAQYYFTRGLLIRALRSQLDTWGRELQQELVVSGRWALHGFRHAAPAAPYYYVVADDGLIVDIQGFVPGLLPKVTAPPWPVYDEPATVHSSLGESWTLFGKRLRDGVVLLGVEASPDVGDAAALLKRNAKQFGSTVDEAVGVRPRTLDLSIDYAVIDSSGEMRQAVGGIPLTTNRSAIARTLSSGPVVYLGGEPYFLYALPIRDEGLKEGSVIVVFENIGVEQKMLRRALWTYPGFVDG